MDEDFKFSLTEFSYYKSLILNDKTDGRNVIIELKDGMHQVISMSWLADRYFSKWNEIERITVFVKTRKNRASKPVWAEYEFVSTA